MDTDAHTDADTDPRVAPDSEVPRGCDGPLVFPDENLEDAVRDLVGILSGDLYHSDVMMITALSAADSSVSDQTGIQ